ncbi:hypothetical protein BUALT_Bualt19G0093200 [Buddleja alternifolia]|uniref:Mitochondrial carrier protein n=1 Tax=Buddleja alternifolia TaxID=168488 RepID=A0AAV6W653_9LAMI|nr:hypothetical protein BUALT_Bualt19G0093200 [Buddleja alternifolia]
MDELWKYKSFAVHGAAAAGSVTLGNALTYPLDTLKVLIQVGSSTKKTLTVADVLYRVRALSGYSGLYNGVGWLTMGRISGLGVRFGVYEILTGFYKGKSIIVHFFCSLLALSMNSLSGQICWLHLLFIMIKKQFQSWSCIVPGFAAGVMESLNVVPPLVSRLLPRYSLDMTALNNSVGLLSPLTTKNANMLDALKEYPWMMTGSGRPPAVSNVRMPPDIISLEGWTALWRGLRSGLVRDSIFGGVFFSSWQFLHQAMLNWKAVGMDPMPRYDNEVGPLSPIAVSLAAGVSGSFAAAASHGFDTTRCRSQCTVVPKFVAMERKFLKWSRPGKRFERLTGIHPADRNLLLNGVWLRMARCGIASSVIVGSYFLAIDHLISN